MIDQAFGALEYDGLRALLAQRAQTSMGREHALQLSPLSDINALRREIAAVGECRNLRERQGGWSFAELAEPSQLIARARIEGAALEPLALLEVARLCSQAVAARGAVQAAREASPILWETVGNLLPDALQQLAERITRKILPGGEIDDRASPALAEVRQRINRLRSDITRSLERLMRRTEEAIQDQLVTVRNDRFVIPVRNDHRSRVHGVAHGSSSSGATVFIEPLETIDSNNELQSLREQEAREVFQILLGLSDEVRQALPAVEQAVHVIAELDFINARAVLAAYFECAAPQITETGALELLDARHPLLEENLRQSGRGDGVVPVSFTLDAARPVMVISGANAGGKTVVLKTAGLLSLMALSGLHVPARAASFPLYQAILADIGDRQSLAANLSTFTAHMTNIRGMIEICAPPALVLLDEAGTGTDPEEGSALGVAIVDHFRRGCAAHVIATTHYSGLKMYAASEDGVLNASVEFDERTLQPTYKLLVGLAGSSSGLEIARRFGLPTTVIAAAAERVNDATREAADYLQRLKRETEEARAQRLAVEEERQAVAEKYAALDAQARAAERERQQSFERALQKATQDFDRRARELFTKIEDRALRSKVEREAQNRAAELRRESEKITREQRAAAAGHGGQSPGDVRVVRRGTAEESAGETVERRQIKTGDQVRLTVLGGTGVVERINDGEAEVRVGALRFREKVDNLELVTEVASPAEPSRGARLRQAASRGTEVHLRAATVEPVAELNVIGRRTDEAVDAVDKFLDEAYLHSYGQVRIIHGHGTGALRRAVADFLRNHPHVARYEQAPPQQGGAGATVVTLKQ